MTKVSTLRPEFVEFIPAKGEPGVIYVSERFRTAMHLCCCGCGLEVITPLNPAKWSLSKQGCQVSLSPSIGNWSFHASLTTGSNEDEFDGLGLCPKSESGWSDASTPLRLPACLTKARPHRRQT